MASNKRASTKRRAVDGDSGQVGKRLRANTASESDADVDALTVSPTRVTEELNGPTDITGNSDQKTMHVSADSTRAVEQLSDSGVDGTGPASNSSTESGPANPADLPLQVSGTAGQRTLQAESAAHAIQGVWQEDINHNVIWTSPCGADYPRELVRRLPALLDIADSVGHRYSLNNVPRTAKWGIGARGDVLNTLCIGDKPASILIVGELQSKWFCNDRGVPHSNASISITPINAGELELAKTLAHRHARYGGSSKPQKRADVVWMSRYQVVREKGEEPEAIHFKHVYDAQVGFGARKAMRQIGHISIDVNDLVVVECRLTRFKCDPKTGAALTTSSWASWRTSFELQSISLLLDGPKVITPDSEDEGEAVAMI